jgi:hypothetical protein
MGKTIREKILAKAGGKKEVFPGEYVFLTSPCPVPGIGGADLRLSLWRPVFSTPIWRHG